jgi:hypothetical protein
MRRITTLFASLLMVAVLVSACATDSRDPTAPIGPRDLAALTDEAAAEEFFGLGIGTLQGGGAVVLKDFVCGLGPAGPTTNSHAVVTPSGNANLSCHGSTAVGPPETLVLKGVPCGTPGGVTTDSHFVWTKSGQANLTCHFHAP